MNFNYKETFNLEDLGQKPLRIYTYPAPVLKIVSQEIISFDENLAQFADQMVRTMYLSKGIGLAAPQVGKSIRMFIIDTNFDIEEEDDSDSVLIKNADPKIFINPKIIKKEGQTLYEEGCLSFPGIYEKVTRFETDTAPICFVFILLRIQRSTGAERT